MLKTMRSYTVRSLPRRNLRLDIHRVLLRACIVLTASSLSMGCALADRKVTLEYQQQPTLRASGRSGDIVMLKPVDNRYDRNKIGDVRNGYGMTTAKVIANNDPAIWVAKAVSRELSSMGYSVSEAEMIEDVSGNAVAVALALDSMHTDFKPGLVTIKATGDLAVEFELFSNGQSFFRRRYAGSFEDGRVVNNPSAENYGKNLEKALQDLLMQALPDIDDAIYDEQARR